MRAVQKNSLVLLLFVAFGCSEAAKESNSKTSVEAPAEKFALDLHPRETTGTRALWDVRSDFSIKYSVEINGAVQPDAEESASASLEAKADMQILSVDSKGTPTGLRGTVRSSLARVDGKSVAALPAGTQTESHTINGETKTTGLPFVLEPEITALAEEVFSSVEAEGPTDGDMFGTSEPRAIGEKWDVNVEQIRELISSPDFSARNARVNGSATLVGLTDVEGVECLHVRANSRIRDANVQLPEGLTLTSVNGTIRGNIYLDKATGLRRKDDADVEFKVSASAQPGVVVTLTIKQTLSRTITR